MFIKKFLTQYLFDLPKRRQVSPVICETGGVGATHLSFS